MYPILQNGGKTPPIFCHAPFPPLNPQTVQSSSPFSSCTTSSLKKILLFSEPPQYYYFLVKLSQFKFLVHTDKNIFVNKFFLSLDISDFV